MSCAEMQVLANELSAALPAGSDMDAMKQHAIFGGPIGEILALISALQAGDKIAAWNSFKRLGDLLLGVTATSPSGGNGGISFAPAAGLVQNFDWGKIVAVLMKILPVILAA